MFRASHGCPRANFATAYTKRRQFCKHLVCTAIEYATCYCNLLTSAQSQWLNRYWPQRCSSRNSPSADFCDILAPQLGIYFALSVLTQVLHERPLHLNDETLAGRRIAEVVSLKLKLSHY
eukprot:IDg21140t1